MNFDQSFIRLLGNEGGYTNNLHDPGGLTNWGITQAVARANGFTGDMRDLKQDQAKVIYRKLYWDTIQADTLPEAVRFDVFDAAVNSGVGQATRWLQRALGVEADGVIGPATLDAAHASNGLSLSKRFSGYRLTFLTGLSNWDSFGRGWARRIANNLMET